MEIVCLKKKREIKGILFKWTEATSHSGSENCVKI